MNTKWEYCAIFYNPYSHTLFFGNRKEDYDAKGFYKVLDALGLEGWEMCGSYSQGASFTLHMKRPCKKLPDGSFFIIGNGTHNIQLSEIIDILEQLVYICTSSFTTWPRPKQ